MGIVSPALPQIQSSFQASAALAAAVMSVFALGRLLSGYPAGLLSEQLGERSVITMGALVFVGGSLVCALASTMSLLLAGRAVQGLGSALFAGASLSYIVRATPSSRGGRAQAYYQGAISLGFIVGPAAGGFVSAALGYHGIFWVSVAISLLAVPVSVLWIQRRPSGSPRGSGLPQGGSAMSAWRSLTYATFAFAVVGNFQVFFDRTGTNFTLVPLFLNARGRFSAEEIGVVLSLSVIVALLLVVPAGMAADRWGARRVTAWTLALSALAIAAMPFFPSRVGLYVTTLAMSAGLNVCGPAVAAYLFATSPLSRGQSVGFYRLSADLGQVLAPLSLGYTTDLAGYEIAFLALAATNVVMWVWSLLLPRK